ncbi:Stk1 family PASTA domain-containing Ser/Thr kinase [Arcanobacterium buesumense]|uniref:non-specific serine/threonine protein kinase n=1 Tax=Arcanobacterium buesumense TaxID=2722751 RepID=A0A6H2EK09_9ACTO|nr:Stk1 family PASTA domain-containing Ser/Thr kinase [Arcanobacterium buesumense]QJC21676.1 Stk1 family PASTA domain-containing Ser/Thr kinase [Arcanobacterium buesumense]
MNLDPLLNVAIEGRYRITSRLARGGMASVYRAHDNRLDRDVAVKIIHSHLAEQPDFVERFIQEARSAAKLTSPHVVNVYDQGVAQTPLGDLPYLVMQLVSGPDLRSELNANGSLPIGMALTIIKQVLQALAIAHSADIVHRDVKPENILLTQPLDISAVISQPTINAQVADFGLARAASKSTQTATVLGTVGYVAPELVTAGTAGPATDIYATGIMLYELIAGSLPFTGETPLAIAYQHAHDQVPQLSDLADWIPASIDSLIRLFTAKDPQKRPQNGQAALDALEDITESIPSDIAIRRIPVFPQQVKETGTSATTQQLTNPVIDQPAANTQKLTAVTRPASVSSSTSKTRRRRRWPLFTALFLLLLALTGTTGWYFLYGPGLRVTLADVSAMSLAQAQETLEKQGFHTSVTHEFSDNIARDSIIGTDPIAGSRIHPDTEVKIRISDGIKHLTVPSLAGLTSAEAEQALKDAGFSDIDHTSNYSDTVEKDHIVSQEPEPDSSIPHNATIHYVISDGRAPVKIPNLSDVKRSELEQTLADLGLTLVLTEEYSDTVPEGNVISQTPEANSAGLRLDEVHVTVSLGPKLVEVPNVIGQQSQNALTTLKNAGFEVKVEKILGGFFGTVRLQDPEGGTKAKPGTTITITVV